ncbi:MAG: PEP-CTERM sorting domain-containing protein [Verrucomicrobiota bacterium]|nr:PEP-CTERM sorting domain-containing protein [Verrucomicrobiota bacterium]
MRLTLPILTSLTCLTAVSTTLAATQGQIVPVAIYTGLDAPFGLAYDPNRDAIWYSHNGANYNFDTVRPFTSFTPAELSGLTKDSRGVYIIGNGTTAKSYSLETYLNTASLAFDNAIDRIIAQVPGEARLVEVDPNFVFDPGNPDALPWDENSSYRPGSAPFVPPLPPVSDGLDVDGSDVFWSPEKGSVYKNGVLFIDKSNPAQKVPGQTIDEGIAGVEKAGDLVYTVSRFSDVNGPRSRTIAAYDADTGELLAYDPDGDETAFRWEDMTFDGRYLYVTDPVGNQDPNDPAGDIYVFEFIITPVPEPSTVIGAAVMGLLAGASVLRRNRK